jgi:NOL1/NOP2/fmu family ribosome biogenesis protein
MQRMNEQQGTRVLRLAIAAVAAALIALALALPAAASADFSLTVEAEGSGTGNWECEVEEGPAKPCEAEYPGGTELVVVAEADPGSEFLEFQGDCGPLICYLTMDEDHSATAVFRAEAAEAFGLIIEEPGMGSGTVQCEVEGGPLEGCEIEYPAGTELTLIAQASPGSEFFEWGGECDSIAGNECELEMDEEKSVEVLFELEPPEFALNIEEPGSGEGTVECIVEGGPLEGCEAEYPEGTELALIAQADPGSEFFEWGGECDLAAGIECEVEMREERTVEAIFEAKPTFSLTITKAGSGSGAVECKVNGGSLKGCEAEYPEGTELALVAKANAGSEFAAYSAGTGSASACSTSPCTFTIEANSKVTATFNLKATPKFALKVKKTGTGTGKVESTSPPSPKISCGTECEKEFSEGTKVTLSQAADPGSEFTGWSGACTGAGACEVTISSAKEVTATFNLKATPKFALKVKKTGTGTGKVESSSPPSPKIICGSECEKEFNEGTVVTLTQSAEAGSEFIGWSGACSGSGTCEVTMSAAKEVTATFNLKPMPKFKLTVSKSGTGTGKVTSTPAGIDCGATCSAEYESGKEVELKQAPEVGSEFVKWSGACTGSGTCKVTMSEARSVTAEFKLIPKPKFKLSVSKAGTGAGTVTSTPAGISCGVTCSAEYEEGKVVELKQQASAGSAFIEWTGACSGAGACKVTMSAAKAVGARFDLVPKFKLTVSKAGAGTGTVTSTPAGIDCGVTCSAEFEEGKEVELKPSPDSGSELLRWSGACEGTGTCKVTMSSAKSVQATFRLIPTFKLQVVKSGTGSGRVTSLPPITAIDCGLACEAKFQAGTEVELTATPDPGSELFKWSGACEGTGTCKVTMSSAKTVHATFKAVPKFKLSVIKSGAGTVTSSPAGIACGTECEHEYSAGTTLTLSAIAAHGYRFQGFTGCDSTAGVTCRVTINAARSVNASFVLGKCKKGFHRKKVKGKPRCVKTRRHASHGRRGRSAGASVSRIGWTF